MSERHLAQAKLTLNEWRGYTKKKEKKKRINK